MDAHLGYTAHEKSPGLRRKNTRNGKTTKTIKGTFGEVEISTPRDREGSFEPVLVPKRQVRMEGLDEKILALYSRGMTTRDIASAMQDLYGVDVSHSLISGVTEAILDEVKAWQNRPLEAIYPIVWLDGQALDGVTLTVNGASQTLMGWYQQIEVPNASHQDLDVSITAPTSRKIQIQKWEN